LSVAAGEGEEGGRGAVGEAAFVGLERVETVPIGGFVGAFFETPPRVTAVPADVFRVPEGTRPMQKKSRNHATTSMASAK